MKLLALGWLVTSLSWYSIACSSSSLVRGTDKFKEIMESEEIQSSQKVKKLVDSLKRVKVGNKYYGREEFSFPFNDGVEFYGSFRYKFLLKFVSSGYKVGMFDYSEIGEVLTKLDCLICNRYNANENSNSSELAFFHSVAGKKLKDYDFSGEGLFHGINSIIEHSEIRLTFQNFKEFLNNYSRTPLILSDNIVSEVIGNMLMFLEKVWLVNMELGSRADADIGFQIVRSLQLGKREYIDDFASNNPLEYYIASAYLNYLDMHRDEFLKDKAGPLGKITRGI